MLENPESDANLSPVLKIRIHKLNYSQGGEYLFKGFLREAFDICPNHGPHP